MKKPNDFLDLLHGERDAGKPYTVQMLADGIFAGRSHVNLVLLNKAVAGKPGFGRQTRRKLVRFFKKNFTAWRAMLGALGWDEAGQQVPRGKFDVKQTEPRSGLKRGRR